MGEHSEGQEQVGRPVWHCFPDGTPPEQVVVGWRMLLGLPPAALRNLWNLLAVALDQPANPESRQLRLRARQRAGGRARL